MIISGLKKTLTFSVRIVAFITIPAMLGLMILREPIIRVLFQHGQFVAASTRITARALLVLRDSTAGAGDGEADRAGILFDARIRGRR